MLSVQAHHPVCSLILVCHLAFHLVHVKVRKGLPQEDLIVTFDQVCFSYLHQMAWCTFHCQKPGTLKRLQNAVHVDLGSISSK